MARYFRCTAPPDECPYSRNKKVFVEKGFVCPAHNSDCKNSRQSVSLWVAVRQLHPRGILLGAVLVVLAVVVLLLVSVFSAGDGADKHAKLQVEVAHLGQRLAELEATPPLPSASEAVASQELEPLLEQVQRLKKDIDGAVTAGAAAEVSRLQGEFQTANQQFEAMTAASRSQGGAEVERSMSAGQLTKDYEAIEERTEAELDAVSSRGDTDGRNAFSKLRDQIRNEMDRAQRLAAPVKVAGLSANDLALQNAITADLEAARQKLNAFLAATTKLPFKIADAGFAIATSPGLAEALVVPLLQAHWSGALTADPDGQRWLLASSDPDVAPGVVVTVAGDDPYAALIKGSADLVITDRPVDTTVRARFAKAFPGKSIDSWAYSEVVGLDAVALLGHPGAPASEIGIAQLSRGPWAVRATDATRIKQLTAGWVAMVPVDDPFLSVLEAQNARSVALFHQCGNNMRAQYLPYRPAPDVRALAPSPFSIGTEDYGLTFRIVATHSPRARSVAKKFINYVTSDEGQDRVSKAGFVDLRLRHRQETPDPSVAEKIRETLGLPSITNAIPYNRYSASLRFGLNKYELDIKAKADIGRLARALASDFPTGKLVILGFTDSTGTAEHNLRLSLKRAEYIAAMLQKFGIAAAAAGLGQQLPVDSNATDQGRARNRRAEIWVVQQ